MAKDIRDSLFFEGIDRRYVEEFLTSLPDPVHLKKGQYLWCQDESGYSMCLLKEGRLEVLIHNKPDEHETVIAHIEAGAVIGEVSLFGEKIRSASIRAEQDSELLSIDGNKFLQKVQQNDAGVLKMCFNVAKLLTKRLVTANDFIRQIQQISEKPQIKSELEHYRERFSQESLFN